MNLTYQLQCTECNAFYIGETCHSSSDRMNGHRFTTTASNPDLPVAIHTQSHQIPLQVCWSTWLHPRPHPPPIWNCIPTCPPIPTHPRSQHPLTSPNSTLTPIALKVSIQSVLFYCWVRPLRFGRNIHFCFVSSLYVLATLTRGPDDTLVSLR